MQLDYYEDRKNFLKSKLIFSLSNLGWALYCDYAIFNRLGCHKIYDEYYIKSLNDGDKLFVDLYTLNSYNIDIDLIINILKEKNIKLNFYLMNEPFVEEKIIQKLLPYSYNLFLQNNRYIHPNVHIMPIGIRDGEETVPSHYGFSHNFLINEKNNIREKTHLCLMCYSTGDNRKDCDVLANNTDFVCNLNNNEYEAQPSIHCGKVPVWIFYKYLNESYYTLCPDGCGVDTHRFFEAIYFNSIPIVKRKNNAFDKMYDIFPCLVINNWDEVTKDILENKKEELQKKLLEFKNKYANMFADLDTLSDLLLTT